VAQILVDRDVLQRLLDEYFELAIEARAFRTLRNRSAARNLPLALEFEKAREGEEDTQRAQLDGVQRILRDSLASGDDTVFQTTLSSLSVGR
jgi:hypothetical protein